MKRFEMSDQSTIYRYSIIDNVKKGVLKVNECVVLLNKLNDENEQLRFQLEECSNNKLFSRRELERENEQLRQTITEMQQDEQLYANEILELREANKEFMQFKELGGDY